MPRSIPPEYYPIELLQIDRGRTRPDENGITRFFFYITPENPPPMWKMQLESAWQDVSVEGHASYDNNRVWLDCPQSDFVEMREKLLFAVERANEATAGFYAECSTAKPSPAPNTNLEKLFDSVEIGSVEGP